MSLPWELRLFTTAGGKQTVAEEIRAEGLSTDVRGRLEARVKLLREFGPALGMPHVRSLSGWSPLRELRINGNRTIYRLIFFNPTGRQLVGLRFFGKQSQKTPKAELQAGWQRMKDWSARYP